MKKSDSRWFETSGTFVEMPKIKNHNFFKIDSQVGRRNMMFWQILILIRRCIGFSWNNTGNAFTFHFFDPFFQFSVLISKYHFGRGVCVLSTSGYNASARVKNLKAYITAMSVDFLCIVVPYTLYMTVSISICKYCNNGHMYRPCFGVSC